MERVLQWNRRTLLLGGGGYDSPNAARAWAYLTSVAVRSWFFLCPDSTHESLPHQLGSALPLDTPIPPDLPSAQYELFAPSFTLDVPEGYMRDANTEETLRRVEKTFEVYEEKLLTRWRRVAK